MSYVCYFFCQRFLKSNKLTGNFEILSIYPYLSEEFFIKLLIYDSEVGIFLCFYFPLFPHISFHSVSNFVSLVFSLLCHFILFHLVVEIVDDSNYPPKNLLVPLPSTQRLSLALSLSFSPPLNSSSLSLLLFLLLISLYHLLFLNLSPSFPPPLSQLSGFSGAILTTIMCDAMNRDVMSVVMGGSGSKSTGVKKVCLSVCLFAWPCVCLCVCVCVCLSGLFSFDLFVCPSQ